MSAALDSLLASAKEGHREDALALWQKATKTKEVEYALSAASLLGYEDEVFAWSYGLWKAKAAKPLALLMQRFGFACEPALIKEMIAALKRSSGKRRAASFCFEELLAMMQDLRARPHQLAFTFSAIGGTGMSLFVGICEDDVLKFVLSPIESPYRHEVEHNIGHDFFFLANHKPKAFYETLEGLTLANCFPTVFAGWEGWDKSERREAVKAWMEEEATPTITLPLCPVDFPSATEAAPVHEASEHLSADENRVYNEILKLFDQDFGSNDPSEDWGRENFERNNAWKALHKRLDSLATPMSEIGLALLSRVLSGWHDEYLNGTFGLKPKRTKYPEMWARLSRGFTFPESFRKLTAFQVERIKAGMLRNARTMVLDCPMRVRQDLLAAATEFPSLRSLEWYRQTKYLADEWEEMTEHPVWSELTRLKWSAFHMCTTSRFLQSELRMWQEEGTPYNAPTGDAAIALTPILAKSSKLIELVLYGVQINESIAQAIVGLPRLEKLILAGCELTEGGREVLAHALPPQLRAIDFYLSDVGRFGQHVAQESLQEVVLVNCNDTILTGAWAPFVEELKWHSDEAIGEGAAYEPFPALRTLELARPTHPKKHLKELFSRGLFPLVETLEISIEAHALYNVTTAPESYIAALTKEVLKATAFPMLRALTISHFNPYFGRAKTPLDWWIKAIVSQKPPPSLRELAFLGLPQNTVINKACGAQLANWAALGQLTKLRMLPGYGEIQKSARNALMKSSHIHDKLTIEWE